MNSTSGQQVPNSAASSHSPSCNSCFLSKKEVSLLFPSGLFIASQLHSNLSAFDSSAHHLWLQCGLLTSYLSCSACKRRRPSPSSSMSLPALPTEAHPPTGSSGSRTSPTPKTLQVPIVRATCTLPSDAFDGIRRLKKQRICL